MASLVLTVIGDDRTGLVSALADVVADHGGNWEQSRMTELAGKFAGVVLITVPDDRADELVAALGPLQGLLDVTARVGSRHDAATTVLTLDLVGSDRPGIVREISQVLAELGVGIDELATSTREAPMAGGVLFEAIATLRLPGDVEVAAVRAALESVADELMVDLDLDLDDHDHDHDHD